MPEKAAKITEESLSLFIDGFYEEVKKDDLLAPVFIKWIGTDEKDWAPHMKRVVDFWVGQFVAPKAGPEAVTHMAKLHNPIKGLDRKHFKKWMEIYLRVVPEYFETSPACDLMIHTQRLMRKVHNEYWDYHDLPRHPKHLSDGEGRRHGE